MLVLQTNDLSKKYSNRYVVDKVNMHIEKGDIYGFVGENGAGKTTIIRLISGLARPSGGDYDLFGNNSKTPEILSARQKVCGIVETVSLIPTMDAKDNIAFQCRLAGKKASNEEIEELIKKVGLDPKEIENKYVGSFSLGMRQRIGIAITLISNPEFVILDEPMNGLDPKGFIEVRDTIIELNKQGITFLISSHILSELEKICTRIGFISHGKLLKELTINELHNQSKPRIEIDTDKPDELAALLKDKLGVKSLSSEVNKVFVFDQIDINDMLKFIVRNNVRINNINKIEDTIETYYMKLMGGNENA